MKIKRFILTSLFLISALLILTNCPPPPQPRIDRGSLIISEVGSCPYVDSPGWIEVYNPTSNTTYLSSYELRTTGWQYIDPNFFPHSDVTFNLPDITIYPGSYALIRGKPFDDMVDGTAVVHIKNSNGIYPNCYDFYDEGGFAELVRDGVTVDFVRFGPSTVTPTTGGQWLVGTAPALPSTGSDDDIIISIARDGANTDTDDSTDWAIQDFSTPGGPNDITGPIVDADADGIPDNCEVSGSTFAGLPLYDWGARDNHRDLFIHVDYMNSSDEGVTPMKEALDRVKDVFLSKNIYVHFDVGDLYDQAPGPDPADHDLDDSGHQVPFAQGIYLGEAGDGRANLFAYKYKYMDLARKQVFHYLIFAYSQNADGSSGSSGLAELNGNDFLVTLGNWGLSSDTPEDTNMLINFQASTLMHELGHNLGLRHGGDENLNFKPNYYSIMNYLYQLNGLPTIGTNEGDRFHLEWYGPADPPAWWAEFTALVDGPLGDPNNFRMDYSDGSGADINENSNDEDLGLRRAGSGWVDYDDSGTHGVVNIDINDDGGDGILDNNGDATTVLHDYDDWSHLNFFFTKNFWADVYGRGPVTKSFTWTDPVGDDHQPVYPEPPIRIPIRK